MPDPADRPNLETLSSPSTAKTFLRRWLPATAGSMESPWHHRNVSPGFHAAVFSLLNEVRVEG